MKGSERVAPVAAAVSALAALACCLPLGIAGAVGALGLSLVLASLRPWLLAFAGIFLGIGLLQLYRGQKRCRRSPLSVILFAMCAAVVLAVVLFPQQLAELMAAFP